MSTVLSNPSQPEPERRFLRLCMDVNNVENFPAASSKRPCNCVIVSIQTRRYIRVRIDNCPNRTAWKHLHIELAKKDIWSLLTILLIILSKHTWRNSCIYSATVLVYCPHTVSTLVYNSNLGHFCIFLESQFSSRATVYIVCTIHIQKYCVYTYIQLHLPNNGHFSWKQSTSSPAGRPVKTTPHTHKRSNLRLRSCI